MTVTAVRLVQLSPNSLGQLQFCGHFLDLSAVTRHALSTALGNESQRSPRDDAKAGGMGSPRLRLMGTNMPLRTLAWAGQS
jgi:hypothetical protein